MRTVGRRSSPKRKRRLTTRQIRLPWLKLIWFPHLRTRDRVVVDPEEFADRPNERLEYRDALFYSRSHLAIQRALAA